MPLYNPASTGITAADYLNPLVPWPKQPTVGRNYTFPPISSGSLSGTAQPAQEIRAVPMLVPEQMTSPVVYAAYEVSTSIGTTGQMALYAGDVNTWMPGALITVLGSAQSNSGVGRKLFAFPGNTGLLSAGLYYVATWMSGATSLRYTAGGGAGIANLVTPSTVPLNSCYVQSGVTSPFPATLEPTGSFAISPRLDFTF